MEATLGRAQRPWFILLDAGLRPAVDGRGRYGAGRGRAGRRPPALRARRSPASGARRPDEQTIRPDAKLLFVAGAGWTKKQADGQPHADEAETLILGFLRKLRKASLGSSKSLVDLSGEGQAVLPS